VISTAINAIPEIVVHGETGLLIAPGDRRALRECLLALISDYNLRHEYGSAGRRRVENQFDSVKNFNKLQKLFEEVANEHP